MDGVHRTLPNHRHVAEETKGVDKLAVLANIMERHKLKVRWGSTTYTLPYHITSLLVTLFLRCHPNLLCPLSPLPCFLFPNCFLFILFYTLPFSPTAH